MTNDNKEAMEKARLEANYQQDWSMAEDAAEVWWDRGFDAGYLAAKSEGGEDENGLKSCPFCGGKAYSSKTVNGTEMFYVGCAPCGFRFKAAWYRNNEKPTKDIIESWNRRS